MFPSAETAGEQRKNLQLLVDAMVEYYKKQHKVDLLSHDDLSNVLIANISSESPLPTGNKAPLLFLDIDKLQ